MNPAPSAQRTISRACVLAGYGLHTGERTAVRCLPAPKGTGVTFVLNGVEIPARLDAVVDSHRGVTLGRGGVVVRTVEHLLAAASALGIANLRVEVDGEELPALDGSARPFADALTAAGAVTQGVAWRPVDLAEPVWVSRGATFVLALPAPILRVTYVVPTGIPSLGTQSIDIRDPAGVFTEQLAPARTWGFASEAAALRAEGLARGASEDNTLGLGPEGFLWPPRFDDEPARHKVLDLLGDIALLGRPLRAHVLAVAAGHALHVELARAIEKRQEAADGSGA
ncbi:MAG TPA: UDP-3-O-acyl-N-acetylglucosamine deacetylase [bacterium]|jgi:UDP-3-O-[3-hydroxymyristoyl] N-acetylglucosamine deacetylase